jgi:hypothetical protein
MTIKLEKYDPELLPPDFLLDASHPANDAYIQKNRLIERQIVQQSKLLKATHLQIVKLHHSGLYGTEIAERLGRSQMTVSKVINTPAAKRLLALLGHYQVSLEGPNLAQRKNMMWRIAQESELSDPRVAIAATETLNKMDEQLIKRQNENSGNQPINLIINQNTFPKGALD